MQSPKKLGDMFELNSHDGWKTGYATFFWQNPKKIEKKYVYAIFFANPKKSRKFYRGNLREYRGNLREYRGNLRTEFSTIFKATFSACVAMAQVFPEQ